MWINEKQYDGVHCHYTVMKTEATISGMEALKSLFPDAVADFMNFVLFSASGVHGSYITIEQVEKTLNNHAAEIYNEDEDCSEITFLIVHPRLVTLRYGTCSPATQADIDYLKALRESSQKAVSIIGF
jgi:hypothetical protein